jgi:hypothetical protein
MSTHKEPHIITQTSRNKRSNTPAFELNGEYFFNCVIKNRNHNDKKFAFNNDRPLFELNLSNMFKSHKY